MSKRPVIGLVPLYDETKESYWMLPGYMTGLEAAGGLPVMMPLTDDPEEIRQLAKMLDGFLLTGGHDVDPALYGEKPVPECGMPCRQRDRMEQALLTEVLKLDKPVFGICRGIQFLNVHLGGTLYQDLPTQKPGEIEHHMTPPYDMPCHSVEVVKDSWLWKVLEAEPEVAAGAGSLSGTEGQAGTGLLQVNSYHHQAIRQLAPSLEAMAYSEDGLVEAVRMPEKSFVAAVQWHPEFSYKVNESSRKLFAAFVVACRKAE